MGTLTPEQIQTILERITEALTHENGDHPIVEETIGGNKYRVYKDTAPNMAAFVLGARKFGDDPFLVFGDERYTFNEVIDRVEAIAYELINTFGIKEGDRVAISMRNYPEYVVTLFAVMVAGGIACPLNSWWTTEEMKYGIGNSGSVLLFADEKRLMRTIPIAKELNLKLVAVRTNYAKLPAGVVPYSAMLSSGLSALRSGKKVPPCRRKLEDDAVLMYTSGSTGFPKGVPQTNRNILQAQATLEMFLKIAQTLKPPPADAPKQEAILCPVPLFHTTGTHAILYPCLIIGRKLVLMPKWSASKALELVETEKITGFTGVPTMVWEMLECPDIKKRDTSTLRLVGGGGAPTPPKQVRRIEPEFGQQASASQGYGLTETNAITTLNSGPLYAAYPTSCGQAVPVVDIQVVDDNGKVLGCDEIGEIWIRGPTVLNRYWNNPEATAKSITSDGWFKSGDLGKVDRNNFVYIVDRKKDIIIRGGENISCAEVEAAFYEHDAVMECAVFGVPDERLGEKVAATVVVKKNQSTTATELKEFVKQHLASFKVPYLVLLQPFDKPLPRGATGKILKRVVREAVIAGLSNMKNKMSDTRAKL